LNGAEGIYAPVVLIGTSSWFSQHGFRVSGWHVVSFDERCGEHLHLSLAVF
jgi:hypothetical protein